MITFSILTTEGYALLTDKISDGTNFSTAQTVIPNDTSIPSFVSRRTKFLDNQTTDHIANFTRK